MGHFVLEVKSLFHFLWGGSLLKVVKVPLEVLNVVKVPLEVLKKLKVIPEKGKY